jgi:hypothetical protein
LTTKVLNENILIAELDFKMYIFCSYQIISFPILTFDSIKFTIESNVFNRSHIYKIAEDQNALYVAVGEYGVDVY